MASYFQHLAPAEETTLVAKSYWSVVDSCEMTIQVWHKQVMWTVGLVAGMLAWFALYHVPALIDSDLKGMSSDVTTLKTEAGGLKERLDKTDSRVEGLLTKLVDAELARTKGLKNQQSSVVKERLEFLAGLLGTAKDAGVSANPETIVEAGKGAMDLATKPELRNAAQDLVRQLVDYRSFLNEGKVPAAAATPNRAGQEQLGAYAFEFRGERLQSNVSFPGTFFSRTVPIAESARLGPLAGGGRAFGKVAPEYVMLEATGFRILLDGYYLRNIILRNAHIAYKGGAVRLENVYFVNCVFEFEDSRNTPALQQVLLSKPSVNFSAVS